MTETESIGPTYGGPCRACGRTHVLTCTAQARAAAEDLMAELRRAGRIDFAAEDPDPSLSTEVLAREEGQMLGVLVCRDDAGGTPTLRAFSGRFNGVARVAGWVDPVPSAVASPEASDVERQIGELGRALASRRAQLALAEAEEAELRRTNRERLATLDTEHLARRAARRAHREALLAERDSASPERRVALEVDLERLADESRRDSSARRRLKAELATGLAPVAESAAQVRAAVERSAAERRALSRRSMEDLHRSYRLTNFRGETRPLVEVFVGHGIPSGAAECCAPKLLQAAAVARLEPLALAEFWWGAPPSAASRVEGRLYPACADKCEPILGFMLCGAAAGERHG